jgi:hypothetical protein
MSLQVPHHCDNEITTDMYILLLGILSNFSLENGSWAVVEIKLTVICIFNYSQAQEMAQLSMKISHLLSLLSNGYRGLFSQR